MNIRNLFFLGSILLLLSCKNSKQQEEYNSVNIIKYINIYNENNRILTAQGTEYDYLYFGGNKDKGILADVNNFIKIYSYDNDSSCYTVEEPLSESLLKTMRYTENTIEELVLENNKDTFSYTFSTFFATLMRFAISRKREYMADAGAAEMTKNPLALASALRKISADPDIEAVEREDVAQLFIQHPGKQAKSALSGLSGLFATHPPIEKRIAILEQF